MEITEQTLEILYDQIDPWMLQTPDSSKDQIFNGMINDIKNGVAYPFEKNGLIFYTIPETKWLYRLHLFSKTSPSITEKYEAANYLTNYLFHNFSDLHKIYGVNPFKSFKRVVSRTGWRQEGMLSNSHMTEKNALKDQYIWSITREENENYNRKT